MSIKPEDFTAYCCMTGNYDNVQEDGRKYVDPCNRFKHNRLNAKVPKILSHKYTDTKFSIWIDSNIVMKITYIELVQLFLEANPDFEVGVFDHPARTKVEEEIATCTRHKLDEQVRLDYHKGRDSGERLAYCGIIVRRNTDLVAQYNEKWWGEISRGSSRDQLSFPYTLGKIATYLPLKPVGDKNTGRQLHENNQYYSRSGHKKGNGLQ